MVKATLLLDIKPVYQFRTQVLGGQVLYIGLACQDWNTNTGVDDEPKYIKWQKATREEAEAILRRMEKWLIQNMSY